MWHSNNQPFEAHCCISIKMLWIHYIIYSVFFLSTVSSVTSPYQLTCMFLIYDHGILEPVISSSPYWFLESLMISVYSSSTYMGPWVCTLCIILIPGIIIFSYFHFLLSLFIHLLKFYFILLHFIHVSKDFILFLE